MKTLSSASVLLLVCLTVCLAVAPARATARQKAQDPGPVEISFLKDSLVVAENDFSFNTIRVSNHSGSPLRMQLLFSAPDFVDMLSGNSFEVVVQPGGSVLEPIRFTGNRNYDGMRWAHFGVQVRVAGAGQPVQASFLVRPKETTRWKAWLPQPVITLTDGDPDRQFEIRLSNEGNTAITCLLNTVTPLETSIPKTDFQVPLRPGETRTVPVVIDLSSPAIRSRKRQQVQIFVHTTTGDEKMLVLDLVQMDNVYSGDCPRWRTMPLTIGMDLFNLASSHGFGMLNVRGFLDLGGQGRMNIFLQTDNFYRNGSANTHMALVEYQNGPWQLQAGTLLEFNNFLVDGTGARLSYKDRANGSYEIMGVRSRTGNTQQFNFKMARPLGGRLVFSSNTFVNRDKLLRENAYLTLNKLDWSVNSKTRLSLEAGAALQDIEHQKLVTVLAGPQWGYHFETGNKFYQMASSVSWYSRNFPGINRGYVYQSHEARLLLNHFYTGPYLEYNKRTFSNPLDSTVGLLFNIDNREYGWRIGRQWSKGSWTVSTGDFSQQQDSASAFRSDMFKLSLNATWRLGRQWWLSILSNTGRVSLSGMSQPSSPFIATNNFVSLQSAHYGLEMHYDRGPYYYYEIRQYVQTGVFLRRIQAAPYVDMALPRWNLFSRLQFNYLHDLSDNVRLMYAYGNIRYVSPRTGWEAGLVTGVNIGTSQQPMLNLSIRKRLQAPVYRNKNAKSFVVVLFLDQNGNGRADQQETRVINAAVIVNGQLLFSNGRGEIEIVNTSQDEFAFDFSRISGLRGWLPSGGNHQVLRPGKENVFALAFVRSRVLTGRIILERDPLSSLTMDTAGIRIIASGPNGDEYATLTNEKGEFFFNLPAGEYMVRINQAVFDKNFSPVEPVREVNLLLNEKLDIQFVVKQVDRRINIHRE